MTQIDIQDRFLIIGAFRYALGRSTYVTLETAQWLIKHWSKIDKNTQELIRKETADAIKNDRAGMECDKDAWKLLLYAIGGDTKKE